MSEPIILSNKIQCLNCGDIIESKHRHDFQMCSCQAVGVDGGRDYLRRIGSALIDLSEVTSEEEEDWFERVRETFTWGSYGKNGDEPLHYIKLSEMTTAHINAVLETQRHIRGSYVEEYMKKELEYRKDRQ